MTYPLFVQLIDEIPQPNSFVSTLILMALGIPLRIFSSSDIVRYSIQLLR
ncbi:MAG: hypothetical protein WD650_01205 [Nitrosopumilaceae archaeon]